MELFRLETIEWTSVWREFAPDRVTPRVLLLGDSISVGYRSVVERHLGGKYHVTALSTSKAVDNPWLIDEILLAVRQEESPIQLVHFNNGLHGGHLTPEQYGAWYEVLLRKLLAALPEARFSLALSTPLADKADLDTLDAERNPDVIARNASVIALAKRLNLPVDDLYSVALSEPGLHTQDGCHFTERGYEVLGAAIATFLTTMPAV